MRLSPTTIVLRSHFRQRQKTHPRRLTDRYLLQVVNFEKANIAEADIQFQPPYPHEIGKQILKWRILRGTQKLYYRKEVNELFGLAIGQPFQ